jgi:hypothetical protein
MSEGVDVLVHAYTLPVRAANGRFWLAQAWAAKQNGAALWRGWLVFLPQDDGTPIWTDTETTQGNLASIRYWARGLQPLYLEGALARALEGRTALRRRPTSGERLAVKAENYERLSRALAAEAENLRRLARKERK